MKQKFFTFITKFTIAAMMWLVSFSSLGGIGVTIAQAAELDFMSAVPSRVQVSTSSDYTIYFKTSTGIATATTNTILITFPSDYSFASVSSTRDVDIATATGSGSGYTACTAATYTTKPIAATASGTTWGSSVATATRALTLTNPTTNQDVPASTCVRVRIGSTAASSSAGGATTAIVNASATGSQTITIAGAMSDSGNVAVGLVSNDKVAETATNPPSLAFVVGATAASTQCSAGSAVTEGGTMAFGSINQSTSTNFGYICTRLSTNASYGAIVQVKSANGALKSTRTTGDTIPTSAITGTPTTSTVNYTTETYGLCVDGAAGGTGSTTAYAAISATSPYNAGACTLTSTNHLVGQLSTSYAEVWHVGDTASNAFANLVGKVSVAATTPAHNDYTDTLTFIAYGAY